MWSDYSNHWATSSGGAIFHAQVPTAIDTPTFTQIGPLCQNSTAPALPDTSNNNITGTWSPATINTSTAGTTTYTFTPDAGQDAAPVTMNILITTQITPTFTQIGPLYQNSTAPALPGTSNNGINGTWSPATINTSTAGTTTYTFTPTAGQCAAPVTMNIEITTQITPTFTQIGPLCQNSTAPALPDTSNNNITGTWSPATINTSTAGTTTYTFTPDAGQCAAPVTMNILITTQITPTFTQIGPLCQNGTAPALPGTSNNGINGTWSPATINTSTAGTTTYSFTPNAGQCATPVTMDIVITTQITPGFTPIGPLCQNSTAPTLVGTSLDGITGTWSPATINTSTAGTTTYTFTPTTGQCAVPVTMNIVIESCCIGSVSVGPDATSYFGLISEQCVTKTAVVQNGTGPYTYSWTLDRTLLPGESMTGANSQIVTVCLLDTANLCVTITDANGCVFTDCAMIFAQDVRCFSGNSDNYKIKMCHNNSTICVDQGTVNTHLSHGDYVGQCNASTATQSEVVGESIPDSRLKIYPNPGHGIFSLYINSRGSDINYIEAEIINMSGQLIKQVKINGQGKIDFRINNAGVYFIRVISTDGKILTRKVVVLE